MLLVVWLVDGRQGWRFIDGLQHMNFCVGADFEARFFGCRSRHPCERIGRRMLMIQMVDML
jgi:hypothetical protein